MFEALMAISALAISVAALVVGRWTMSASAAGIRRLDSWAGHVNNRLTEISGRVTSTSTSQLRAELDDLRGALDVIRASNRKEFGALWGRMGGRGADRAKTFDGATGLPLGDDDELEAVLALQAAKPVGPNGA